MVPVGTVKGGRSVYDESLLPHVVVESEVVNELGSAYDPGLVVEPRPVGELSSVEVKEGAAVEVVEFGNGVTEVEFENAVTDRKESFLGVFCNAEAGQTPKNKTKKATKPLN